MRRATSIRVPVPTSTVEVFRVTLPQLRGTANLSEYAGAPPLAGTQVPITAASVVVRVDAA